MSMNAIELVARHPSTIFDIATSNIAFVAVAMAVLYFASRKASFIKGFSRPRKTITIIFELLSVSLLHACTLVVLSAAFSYNIFKVENPFVFHFLPALIIGFFILLLSASIRFRKEQ